MKKTVILGLIIFVASFIGLGQSLEWVNSMGGIGYERSCDITMDNSGNIYTIGNFEGTVDFDPGIDTLELTASGIRDLFIQKLSADGNLIWAKQVGSVNNEYVHGNSIVVDSLENIYIAGDFSGDVDFDPDTSVSLVNNNGAPFLGSTTDVFILKLDAAGDFVWVKSVGGDSHDYGTSIVRDASGNIFVAGTFDDKVDFDPGVGTFFLTPLNGLPASGEDAIFVLHLDSLGNFISAKSIGSSSGWEVLSSLAIDESDNLYLTGNFSFTFDFGPNSGISNLISKGASDIFVLKINSRGEYLWAKSMGGLKDDYGTGIAVDSSGNVYTTGHFLETVDFDPGLDSLMITSLGERDIFIQKLDTAGNLVWIKRMGGISFAQANAIALDKEGNIHSTGFYRETVDFDPNAGVFNLTTDGAGMYIQKLNSAGDLIWVKSTSGFAGVQGTAIALDFLGNIYTTGSWELTADFDPDTSSVNLTARGERDVFIQKLRVAYPVNVVSLSSTDIKLYPNPTNGLFTVALPEGSREAQITVVDLTGKLVYQSMLKNIENELNLFHLPSGMYQVNVTLHAGEEAYGKIMLSR